MKVRLLLAGLALACAVPVLHAQTLEVRGRDSAREAERRGEGLGANLADMRKVRSTSRGGTTTRHRRASKRAGTGAGVRQGEATRGYTL